MPADAGVRIKGEKFIIRLPIPTYLSQLYYRVGGQANERSVALFTPFLASL